MSSFLFGLVNTKTLPVSSAIFEPSLGGQLKGKTIERTSDAALENMFLKSVSGLRFHLW